MPIPTGQENMAGALLTGQGICWNENHGYYLRNGSGKGELNPDVDCSYFVGYCLAQNGFNVSPSWYTGSMITTLNDYAGFTHYIYDSSFTPMNGDIFVYDEGGGARGHTFFVAENINGYESQTSTNIVRLALARVEAANDRGHVDPDTDEPIPGDQANNSGVHDEVWVHPWEAPSSAHTWHVFRWQGGTPPPTGRIPVWVMAKNEMERKKRKSFDFHLKM